MKNKKLIYILLPLVLAIWVTIFIKVFSIAKKPQNFENNEFINLKENEEKPKMDTFSIIANYSDPFLKNQKFNETNTENEDQNNKEEQKLIEKENKEKSIKWPKLDYCGLVNNNTKNQIIGFLKIDEKDFLVKQGDTVKGIFLENIYNDSIKLNFKDVSRIIKKK
jgi:hypothetical protein